MTSLNDIYTTPLSPEECLALTFSFNAYIQDLGQTFNKEERKELANKLIKKYESIFLKNPTVHALYTKSNKSNKSEFFTLNNNDISNLTTPRKLTHYTNSQYHLSPLKGRLLIFILELMGFYKRPPERYKNALYEAVKAVIYTSPVSDDNGSDSHEKNRSDDKVPPGGISNEKMKDLVGTYQIFRKSFNNSFPNSIATHTLKIFYDQDSAGNNILSYKTRNKYDQAQSGNASESLQRVRTSKGHIFNYQGLFFFLGAIHYTHLGETESDSGDYNYPEVKLMHMHGGDKNSIRGLMLSHYPFLGLPVSTSVLMTKLSNEEALRLDALEHAEKLKLGKLERNVDDEHEHLTEREQAELIARYYGNINPHARDCSGAEGSIKAAHEELVRLVAEKADFVTNNIEEKYSKMLTP